MNQAAQVPPCDFRVKVRILPAEEAHILDWTRSIGRQLGAVALLAILVRALLPGGYMLAAADTPDGRFVVMQLCDSHAQPVSALNLDTGELVDIADVPLKKSGGEKSDYPPCAFAAAVAMSAPPSAVALPLLAFVRQVDLPTQAYVQPGRGLPAPPPPATGPPNLI